MSKKVFLFLAAVVLAALPIDSWSGTILSADVVIYGGTPAGLAAAEAVVRNGRTAIVIEPTAHVGGMETGGIAVTDTGTPQYVGGIAREFFEQVSAQESSHRVLAHTMQFRGKTIPWYEPRAWDLEPHVARQVFSAWIDKGRYRVLLNKQAAKVRKAGLQLTGIVLSDGTLVNGKEFIDASYEGDLMVRAGVSFTYGRESSAQYGESLAGVREPHFKRNYTPEEYATPTKEYMHHGQFGAQLIGKPNGRLLAGVEEGPLGEVGAADKRMQAFCYRLIVTQRLDLKRPWWKPEHYDPARYELLASYIQAHPQITFARLVHLGPVPGGKWDLNASGPFSIDFIGGNIGYFEASYKDREAFLQAHKDYEQGFFWFLVSDPRIPVQLKDEVLSWGPAKDEWTGNDNWPTQLYIREGRRLVGEYVMTQNDIVRDKSKDDSVGMGSFVMDSHWVRRFVNPRGFVEVEGHLDESINLAAAPYEIPYRSLIPKRNEAANLLVPVDMSATHVAICTIRMEPVYMVLGHSAGVAAVMALNAHKAVQDIDTKALTNELEKEDQILHKSNAKPLPANPPAPDLLRMKEPK